ncbi:MAG: PEGA domain-containing protein [Verrucomicrobiota bacterium]
MKKFISVALFAALALVARAQTETAEVVRSTNVWFTTNITPHTAVTETIKPRALRKIAIIVQNRGSAGLNDKVAVLEDLVVSRVAGRGFSVISRDDVTRSLKNYSAGKDPNGELSALDRSLEDGSSALRLAQNLGADYVLVPSIVSLGTEKKNYNGSGISTLNITHRLRVSYKIIEGGVGGAVRGGAFASEKNIRQTGDLQTESSDIVNDLLDDAAEQLAAAIVESGKSLPAEVAKAALVNFNVACTMTDPRQQPILISALGITADNRVVVTNPPVALQALDVTVELDGVALGSAPGVLQGRPGLHKIRLSREGFDPWERTINIYEGQTLRVALQMSAAGYARWADTTAFLAGLDATRKLTDAEVKRIEGIAEFFKNSHYRVDTKENVHVTYKSLF